MKHIKILAALLLTASLSGCLEDKGNYDYIPAEEVLPVKVTGLPEEATFDLGTRVNLKPVIEGLTKPESEYQYTWYTYPNAASGYIPLRDTIGREKDLSFIIDYPPGVARTFVFVIEDKLTNVRSFTPILVSVQALPIGAGYYVTKDIDGQTDLDYVAMDGTQHYDLLQYFIGRRLDGKGVKSHYQPGNYRHMYEYEDGTTTTLLNQKALHVLSERDAVTLNATTFELFKNFDQMFYGRVVPAPTDISNANVASRGLFMMNSHNLHTLYGMSSNLGMYGDSKSRTDNIEPYLFPQFLNCPNPEVILCFDMNLRSFCYGSTGSTRMADAARQPSDKQDLPSAVNMDMDMVALLDRLSDQSNHTGAPGWAIMKSVSQPYKYYIADLLFLNESYPFRDFDELADGRGLPHGEVFAANRSVAAIYFANGNKISYYVKNDSDADSEEYPITFREGQLTADERVAYMSHLYNGTKLTEEFAVLTNNAGGWKLYIFPLISGGARLDTENVRIYSGTGNGRHVMFRN